MHIGQRLLVVGVLGLAAAACQNTPQGAEMGMLDLAGTAWVAEYIDGQPVIDVVRSTLSFEADRQLTGNGGCNGFFGRYQIDGDRLAIGPLAVTKRACAPAINDQEQRFIRALAGVARFEIEDDLLLLFSNGAQAVTRLTAKEN